MIRIVTLFSFIKLLKKGYLISNRYTFGLSSPYLYNNNIVIILLYYIIDIIDDNYLSY